MMAEKLNQLIQSGDGKACANWIVSLNYKEKRSLTNQAIKIFKILDETHWQSDQAQREKIEKQLTAAKIAIFGLATISEIIKIGWKLRPDFNNFAEFSIRTYQYDKAWVDEWIERLFDINQIRFLTAYELYQNGYCNRPSHDNYYIDLVGNFNNDLKNELLKRPDLLELEIWKLFELEGTSECNLASNKTYSRIGWDSTLSELANEGVISRHRLLCSSLDALDKDFLQRRSGWFSRFHETLKPTIQERIEFEERYINLLGSQNPPTVSFALKALTNISKKHSLNVPMLLEHIEPVLYAKAKVTVTAALKLLKLVAKNNETCKAQAAIVAVSALCHESADVQKIAFDVIEALGSKDNQALIDCLSLNAEMVAPSQHSRLTDWCQLTIENDDSEFDITNCDDPFAKIETISSLDDLLVRLAIFLESPEQPDELEKLLTSIAEIKVFRDDAFAKQTQALAKRAEKVRQISEQHSIKHFMALLTLSFICNKNLINADESLTFKKCASYAFNEVLLDHIRHVAELLTLNEPVQLLASPTHGRGFIAPHTLLSRYRSNQQQCIEMPVSEQVLGLLRLDKRVEFIDDILNINEDDEFINALLYALGHEVEFGQNIALWIAASRIRYPEKKDVQLIEQFNYRAPDAFEPAKYQIRFDIDEPPYNWCWLKLKTELALPMPIEINNVTTLFHQHSDDTWFSGFYGSEDVVTRWISTIWPSNLTSYFGYALSFFSPAENSEWSWKCLFEPMLKSDVELPYTATMLLLNGLAAQMPCQKSMAIEAAIQSIADGRLDINIAAQAMSVLLPSQFITVNRWAKTFNEVASISPLHADFIRQLITKSLSFSPEDSPRNLGNVIELLYELQLATHQPITEACAIEFFKSNKKGGKQKTFANKLLALK